MSSFGTVAHLNCRRAEARDEMKYFDLEFESDKPSAEVLRDTVSTWTSKLATEGYTLTSQSEFAVTYHRRYRTWPTILVAILLFPIGLLFLLLTADATITATIEPDDETGGSVLIINGRAPRNVRRALEAAYAATSS
jgi:hypothetical protein